MPSEKNLEQRLRMQLLRDKRNLETKKSSRAVALDISTDPDESAERRSEFRAKYQKLVKEVRDLETKIQTGQKEVNKAKATKSLSVYDEEKGQEQMDIIKEKYSLLSNAYALDQDESIKSKLEGLVEDYKKASTSVSGRPISLAAARTALTGNTPTFASPTGTQTQQPVTPSVKPETQPGTPAKTSLPSTGGKTKPAVVADSKVPTTPAKQLPAVTESKTSLNSLLAKTDFWYNLPDYIFKLDPKLGELLVKAVDEGWDNEKFLASAKLTPWFQKNAPTIRTRIIDRAKYDELKAAGEDVSKSDYGLYLSKQMRAVKSKARELAGVTLTDEQAQSVAQKIYDGFLDDDPLAINALITPFIGKVSSIAGTGTGAKQTGFSGQALQNYQTLQGIAKANGFSLKDILPNISSVTAGGDLETAVLRGLAEGSIDINRVAQDARMLASQGQPEYVRNLLGQGYDLEAIYAPYRKTMATELELDPNQIDLNDSTLRMAITDKGDMNLFDFKKQLRQDNRWQYTGTAKEEVSNAALKVLRDFGFQG
jgi:hypothetical protein